MTRWCVATYSACTAYVQPDCRSQYTSIALNVRCSSAPTRSHVNNSLVHLLVPLAEPIRRHRSRRGAPLCVVPFALKSPTAVCPPFVRRIRILLLVVNRLGFFSSFFHPPPPRRFPDQFSGHRVRTRVHMHECA